MQHVKAGLVTYEEALNHVSNPTTSRCASAASSPTSDATWDNFQDGEGGPKSEDLMVPDEAGGREAGGQARGEAKEEDDFIQKF